MHALNADKSLMKRLATFAFITVFLLTCVSPISLESYMPQTRGSEYDNGAFDSLASQIVVRRAPPIEEKVLVVRAQLSGSLFDVNINTMRTLYTIDVKNYYQEVSYNEVYMNTTFTNKNYTTLYNEAHYGVGTTSEPNVFDLVQELLTSTSVKTDVNALGGYQIFRHIIIVHSGTDQAVTRVDSDITSQFIYNPGGELFTVDGVKIMNACVVSEYDPLGVIVHELGHSLGLPDLYSYAASELGIADTFVGDWDLMAAGSWNPGGFGTSPSHPTTWCKIRLGWIKPIQIVSVSQSSIAGGYNATILLNPQELQNDTLAIKILLNNGTYYLVECRLKIGYDGALPSNGVLVLFCDDSKPSGEGPVRVMSATPPSLGPGAVFNVGLFAQPFYGDSHSDIGVKVINKWSNGTYKVFIGNYTSALNAPVEYVENLNIPLLVLIVGAAVLAILAVILYLKKGRQRASGSGNDSIPVIKLS